MIEKIIIHNGKFYPVEHLLIYKDFKQKSSSKIFITFHCVREILRRKKYPISRQWHYVILREMEYLELIRRIGSPNGKNIKFELIGKDIDNLLNQFNII